MNGRMFSSVAGCVKRSAQRAGFTDSLKNHADKATALEGTRMEPPFPIPPDRDAPREAWADYYEACIAKGADQIATPLGVVDRRIAESPWPHVADRVYDLAQLAFWIFLAWILFR